MSNHLLFEVRLVYKSIHARVASYVACKHFIAPGVVRSLCCIDRNSNPVFKQSLLKKKFTKQRTIIIINLAD